MRLSSILTGSAFAALAFLVAAACGGSGTASIETPADAAADTGSPGTIGVVGTPPDGGGPDAAAVDAGSCPRTYAAATGTCTGSAEPTATDAVCTYPEGTCRCAPARCGGVVFPGDDDAGPSLTWRCAAPRTDGCPETDPNGTPCTDADARKTCSYASGCCTSFATCSNGRWSTRPGACPL